jgi:hypothetical protein
MATLAPSVARRLAIAAPMPRDPPVTARPARQFLSIVSAHMFRSFCVLSLYVSQALPQSYVVVEFDGFKQS